MPIIRPEGLLRGERISQLSDKARLYWPFLYAASNGYGRFEIDYVLIIETAFRQFDQKPSEELLIELLQEYRAAQLLFVYEVGDTVWGAWDSASGQQYFNKSDKASPPPPEPEFSEWRNSYRAGKNGVPKARCGFLGRTLIKSEPSTYDNENPEAQYRKGVVSENSITNTQHSTTHTQHNTSISVTEKVETQSTVSSPAPVDPGTPQPLLLVKRAANTCTAHEALVEYAVQTGRKISRFEAGDFTAAWEAASLSTRISAYRFMKTWGSRMKHRDQQFIKTPKAYMDAMPWADEEGYISPPVTSTGAEVDIHSYLSEDPAKEREKWFEQVRRERQAQKTA